MGAISQMNLYRRWVFRLSRGRLYISPEHCLIRAIDPSEPKTKTAIRLACGLEHELPGLRDYNEIEQFRFWDAGGERPPYHDVGMWRESLSSKMCYCLSAKI